MPMQATPEIRHDLVRQALIDFPRPDRQANELLTAWLAERDVQDPPSQLDAITFHYQHRLLGEGRSGVRYDALITQKLHLVDALLANWQGEPASGYGGFHYGDWAGTPPPGPLNLVQRLQPLGVFSNADAFQVFNGIYRRQQPPRYAEDTRVPIRAEEFQTFIWNRHFHTRFKQSLDDYWRNRQGQYRRAIRIAFIAACNRQLREGSLDERSRIWIWQAAGLLPREDVVLSMLNVYGYASPSIVQISHTERAEVVLYIPGNAAPFHLFATRLAMQQWFAAQCRDPEKKHALLSHFTRADWPDGLDFSGLRTALSGLAVYPLPHRFPASHPGFATSGFWDPAQMIDYQPAAYSPPIAGDLFDYLTQRQKQRAYSDVQSQIVSNHDISKTHWSNYLGLATTLLMPLMVIIPELTPLLIATGMAQFGLGLDAAVNGRTLENKSQGVTDQVFGLLSAAPVAGALASRPVEVFRFARQGFFTSERLSELLGAPFGAAPVVPDLELEPAELAFREPPTRSVNTIAALVARVDDHLRHRFAAWLRIGTRVVNDWVEYEFASDSFIRTSEARLISPPRWIVAADDDTALVLATTPRTATHEQRMATLHALGVQVELPIDYVPYAELQRTPIPSIVSSIWLGDRPLYGEFLETLRHNAQALHDSGHRFQVFLSRQNLDAYQQNLSLLRDASSQAHLLALEDQDFYQTFSQSPYFAQYQAALEGNGGPGRNYSSACDILRYRLLQHYGGLYLDADDKLLLATGTQTELPLKRIELQTTADGLVLAPPVSNDQMGLYIKFNSSMIGSHPGNPTLDAISNEILTRYALAEDFYRLRPDPLNQPLQFQAYARQLNLLTGPGVLNDVIDVQLPWLMQLREICNLLVSPLYDVHNTLNLGLVSEVVREHLPLHQVAQMGQAHSWAERSLQVQTTM